MTVKSFIAALLVAVMIVSLASCAQVNPDRQTDRSGAPSAKVGNLDGEIPGNSGGAFTSGDSIKAACADYAAEEEKYTVSPGMDDSATGTAGGYYTEGEPLPADQLVYTVGTLTAGEWRDNNSFSDWKSKFQQNEWSSIAADWNINTLNRIEVEVRNGDTPVRGAVVDLLDSSNQKLWSAVTDNRGIAYVFNTYNDRKSARIDVRADGKTASADCTDTDSVTIQLAADNTAVKLDLMFMVDTTGSMGDELEYLKTELKDVVMRANSQNQLSSVRTSVNFYRDESDEYIVRYFAFRDDIDETVAKLAEQRADGGGDYPEAVHTALDNAVNQHAWDDDSVKLMFLVLDAPPHYNDDVVASINASIARAAELGIRVIPVMASGSDQTCEVVFRSLAVLTGGTYVFITDDSGVGGAHSAPDVGDYSVEKLNDLMVRIIGEYCA